MAWPKFRQNYQENHCQLRVPTGPTSLKTKQKEVLKALWNIELNSLVLETQKLQVEIVF